MSWISEIDPTYSKGWLGEKLGPTGVEISREVVATSAVGLTGGTVLLFRPDLAGAAKRGYLTGATAGLAGGSPLRMIAAGAQTAAAQIEPTGTGAFAQPTADATAGPDLMAFLRMPIVWLVGAGVLLVLFLRR